MKPITIIGGGLAGLTLGIFLRRENVPVAIIEASHYPRHRVCGEFISGRGRDILRELRIEDKLGEKREATTCSFHLRNCQPVTMGLKFPGLCVSRYDLDAALAEEFQRLGGILKTGERASFENREGHVQATGRRRSKMPGARLFGLKAHASNAELSSDLEMHFGRDQYVGLCRLESGEINACGLFFGADLRRSWRNVLEGAVWSESLRDVAWDEESFCSVAGLTVDRDAPEDLFCVGDSAAMIPPVTGNGMSMAFESAQLAAEFAENYSAGKKSWADCLRDYQATWRAEFTARLRWAAFIQKLVFRPIGQRFLLQATQIFPYLPGLFFSKTR